MSVLLLDAIDKLVEEKTFGLDALDAIKGLRDKALILETENKSHVDKVGRLQGENADLRKQLEDARADIEALTSAEAEVTLREQKANQSIYEAEKHKAVADAYKDAMQIVFRPHAVRETIARSVPVPMQYPNGSGGTMTTVQSFEQTDMVTRESV